MKQEQAVECWRCEEQFDVSLPKQKVDSLMAVCPYCDTEFTLELKPPKTTLSVFRGDKNQATETGYHLPDVIKTNQSMEASKQEV